MSAAEKTSRLRWPQRMPPFLGANTGTKIISLLIAILLWVIVLGSRNVEMNRSYPIELITPDNLAVANPGDVPRRVTYRLRGPKAFLRNVMEKDVEPIRIDLLSAGPGAVTRRFFKENVRLPIGVSVEGIVPSSLLVRLETVRTRAVPVRVEFVGTLREGYELGDVMVKPARAKLKGARSRVYRLSEITTKPIDLSKLTRNFEGKLDLDLEGYGVVPLSEAPDVRVEVKAVSANFKISNVPIKGKGLVAEPASVTVYVRAGEKEIELLEEKPDLVFAEISEEKGTRRGMRKVLIKAPDGIGIVQVEPEEVRVSPAPRVKSGP
jgi:YbbR domain-containing protein